MKVKKIAIFDAREIETSLTLIEVMRQDEDTARLDSATPLETEELVMLLNYAGKRVSRVRVENIPPKVDVA